MDKKQPLLSICIPTYNRAYYLEQSLNSYVDNCAFDDDVEIVISDNASSDQTKTIGLKYASMYCNIKYYRNESNIRDANFSKCLDRATGVYIKLENDNTLINPDGLQYIKNKIREFQTSKPPLFFTDGYIFNHKKQDVVTCDSFGEFVVYTSFYVTALGMFGCWKKDWDIIVDRLKYTNYKLNQDDWTYQILQKSNKAVLCTQKFGKSMNVGLRQGYNWFEVHVDNYYKILQPYIDRGFVSKRQLRIEHMTNLRGIKLHILARYYNKVLPLYQFDRSGMERILFKHFGKDIFFYFFILVFPVWSIYYIIRDSIEK